jgi:hypothetical protein
MQISNKCNFWKSVDTPRYQNDFVFRDKSDFQSQGNDGLYGIYYMLVVVFIHVHSKKYDRATELTTYQMNTTISSTTMLCIASGISDHHDVINALPKHTHVWLGIKSFKAKCSTTVAGITNSITM